MDSLGITLEDINGDPSDDSIEIDSVELFVISSIELGRSNLSQVLEGWLMTESLTVQLHCASFTFEG